MPSLIECTLDAIRSPGSRLSDEDILAMFDLDANEIAAVDGAWEEVIEPGDYSDADDLFKSSGPSVYIIGDLAVVRGIRKGKYFWMVFQPAGSGIVLGS